MKDEQLKLKVICTELPGTRFEDPYGFALRRALLILHGKRRHKWLLNPES